jgi:hypothetical protein
MGYETTFEGKFTFDRPLTPEHKAVLDELAQAEHVAGEDGKPARGAGETVSYCQWTPTPDGRGLHWDMGEKFYCWQQWLEYIIERHLKPWGYTLGGQVRWQGEETGDAGVIYVRGNRVEAVPDVNPGPSWDRKFAPVSPVES